MDTASWITEVTCLGCKVCGQHSDQHFDITRRACEDCEGFASRSRSASWVSCGSGCPGACRKEQLRRTSSFIFLKEKCSFKEKYLEGSALEGLWFRDEVRFDSEPGAITATLGCSFKETGLFASQRQNGILGLAPGSEARPTLLWHIFKNRHGHAVNSIRRRPAVNIVNMVSIRQYI